MRSVHVGHPGSAARASRRPSASTTTSTRSAGSVRGENQRQVQGRRPPRPAGRAGLHAARWHAPVQEAGRLGRNLLEGLIMLNDGLSTGHLPARLRSRSPERPQCLVPARSIRADGRAVDLFPSRASGRSPAGARHVGRSSRPVVHLPASTDRCTCPVPAPLSSPRTDSLPASPAQHPSPPLLPSAGPNALDFPAEHPRLRRGLPHESGAEEPDAILLASASRVVSY